MIQTKITEGRQVYDGVYKLKLEGNCDVVLEPETERSWKDLFRKDFYKTTGARLTLEDKVDSDDIIVDAKTGTLTLKNYAGKIAVPPRKYVIVENKAGVNNISGKLNTGRVISKEGVEGIVDIDIPFNYGKIHELDGLKTFGWDLVGTLLTGTFLYAGAQGIASILPESATFNASDYWNTLGVMATGLWASIRGGRQTMITNSLMAAALILGPEVLDGTSGAETLGWEDVFKGALYGLTLPVGKQIREFAEEKFGL
ncbi:hypothetical protein COV11_00965 [Candidatus Woesearchaeota archaeon CG10_big_fil_rev_8_21_14_0_10_30_7]|nr:MAG: hypothetical protein COV11_00965 [Candidatus Woesearchaeota archaeon CG10_big_fil_rev_8_21_14_0_10_30_7]